MFNKYPVKWFRVFLMSFGVVGFLTPSVATNALTQSMNQMQSPTGSSLLNSPMQLAQVQGCPRAEMVESYETANFYAYICRTQQGDLFYHGVGKQDGSQINVMNVTTGDDGTYYATNDKVTYSVNPNRLQVTQNGRVILNEAVLK